jgi:hypothetical protein
VASSADWAARRVLHHDQVDRPVVLLAPSRSGREVRDERPEHGSEDRGQAKVTQGVGGDREKQRMSERMRSR